MLAPSLNGFRIGDVVQFRVRNIDNLIVWGEASKVDSKSLNWVTALVLVSNTDNVKCLENSIYPGVVSLVDLDSNRLEVVLSTWIVSSVSNRKENKLNKLRTGQQVVSIVVAYCSRELVVVALRGHALGCFGILPAKRIFNDFVGVSAWSIGQRNKVTFRQ